MQRKLVAAFFYLVRGKLHVESTACPERKQCTGSKLTIESTYLLKPQALHSAPDLNEYI